jgi:hypothetical protein
MQHFAFFIMLSLCHFIQPDFAPVFIFPILPNVVACADKAVLRYCVLDIQQILPYI